MKRIYLIRHGRQNSSLCNVDVPLAEEGKKQAELLGPRLAGYGIQKIYHSTLIRARETAQILNEFLQIPIQELPFIQEVDFGGFTGKTEEEISEVYGEYKKQRSTHKEDIPYPDGGECGQDVVERAMPVIRKICSEPEEVTAVVTHGGVIRSLCACITGTEQRHKLKYGIDLENTSITEILYDETCFSWNGLMTMLIWNIHRNCSGEAGNSHWKECNWHGKKEENW